MEKTDVLIVGAGPAGLALGACLKREGAATILLERGPAPGWSWENHYRRLRLHTVKEYSALPFVPFPRSAPRYVSRAEFADYLRAYARTESLDVRPGKEVTRLAREHGVWVARTAAGQAFEAPAAVVATGYNREPNVPAWPGQERFRGRIVHSAQYRDARPFVGRRVLVVGIGNTGAEIALDLAENGARAAVAVRGGVNIVPRDFAGRPTQVTAVRLLWLPARVRDAIGRLLSRRAFGDLAALGLPPLPYGPISQIERYGRLPVIDVGTVERVRRGEIRVVPGPASFTETGVVFTDGEERPYDDVVLATGYRPALARFLVGASQLVDDCGYPRGDGATALPGLFFLGFARPKAGVLREIALGARRLAREVAAYAKGA